MNYFNLTASDSTVWLVAADYHEERGETLLANVYRNELYCTSCVKDDLIANDVFENEFVLWDDCLYVSGEGAFHIGNGYIGNFYRNHRIGYGYSSGHGSGDGYGEGQGSPDGLIRSEDLYV